MQKHYSLVHSEKVLKALRKAMPKEISKDVTVDCWSNGREQGFHLSRYSHSPEPNLELVFAQQRNSDMVLVVVGKSLDFDITTNQPSDEIWETGRKEYGHDEDAVFHIIKHLVG